LIEQFGAVQKLVMFLRTVQDGQGADVVEQPGQHGLIRHDTRTLARQCPGNGGDLYTVFPDGPQPLVDHVVGRLEHLLHDLAGHQVAHQLVSQPGNDHWQSIDFLASTIQGGIADLNQAR